MEAGGGSAGAALGKDLKTVILWFFGVGCSGYGFCFGFLWFFGFGCNVFKVDDEKPCISSCFICISLIQSTRRLWATRKVITPTPSSSHIVPFNLLVKADPQYLQSKASLQIMDSIIQGTFCGTLKSDGSIINATIAPLKSALDAKPSADFEILRPPTRKSMVEQSESGKINADPNKLEKLKGPRGDSYYSSQVVQIQQRPRFKDDEPHGLKGK